MRWRAVCQVGSQARSSRFIVAFEEKNVERRTLVGVDHEGAGTTMKPVSSPRSSLSLSLSPHELITLFTIRRMRAAQLHK